MTKKERFLLAVPILEQNRQWTPENEADQMKELISSCGGEITDVVFCRCSPPTPSHLITSGKVEEIKALCAKEKFSGVLISCDIKGVHQRNMESDFGVKVLDRTQIILDIFAKHAKSLEGKMQVELAQLQYLLPRLVGSSEELSRQGGGIGTSGPGETKLEVDRRRIRDRISRLKKDLVTVSKSREIKRKKRSEEKIPSVTLVGYTNAGKSTLLNTLTNAGTRTHDGLFTTLDSLSRKGELAHNRLVVFSDTVGFMNNLPHALIEAFKATLEEVQHSDLLLHVIDVSHPQYEHFYNSVNEVLKELESLELPTILVLNKIDQLKEEHRIAQFRRLSKNVIAISALNNLHIDDLLKMIDKILSKDMVEINITLPLSAMDIVHQVHQHGKDVQIKYLTKSIKIQAKLPKSVAAKLIPNFQQTAE